MTPPINATIDIAVSDEENKGKNLATKNTPAATIVAACIKALTGVGPSIASGNQTCKGNCPDFPTAPAKIPTAIQVTAAGAINPSLTVSPRSTIDNEFPNCETPSVLNIKYNIAIKNPKSPIRVTRNAFFAAEAALGLVNQNPISKYEHNPTSSQKINN